MPDEPRHDLARNRIRPSLNLRAGLILNRMRDVNRVEVRPPQSRGLRSRRQHKLVRGHRHRGNSPIL